MPFLNLHGGVSGVRAVCILLGLGGGLFGCVVAYQPLSGLHRPLAIEAFDDNFAGLKLWIVCSADGFGRGAAQRTCSRLAALYEGQGARVQTSIEGTAAAVSPASGERSVSFEPDLVVSLRPRIISNQFSVAEHVVSWLTLTMVPASSEFTFSLDVEVKDTSGFLLNSTTLTGRFTQYMGASYFALSLLLDWLVLAPDERLTKKVARERFSTDFFGQMTQLVFDARARLSLLTSASVVKPNGE